MWKKTAREQKCKENMAIVVCGTVVSVVEDFGRELGTENRPMYGEKLQTLIPLGLWKTILGHSEVSHASTTILGLVHLFIFYVFPSNEAQETDV